MTIYHIDPVAKPRQTRADKWKKRACVLKYRAYKDEIRLRKVQVPEGNAHITFVVQMPASWSNKKRDVMSGQRHQQVPDVDNFHKGLLDAVFLEDCRVWDHRITKLWGDAGAIIVQDIEEPA